MNSIKFYVKKEGDNLLPIEGQVITSILESNFKIRIAEDKELPFAPNYEVIMEFETKKIEQIRPVSFELKKESLKLANELNLQIVDFLTKEEKQEFIVDKEEIQNIIDRMYHYGDSYKEQLKNLHNKFPLNVEYIEVEDGLDENGNKLFVKHRKSTPVDFVID